jgi:hypothetical protein
MRLSATLYQWIVSFCTVAIATVASATDSPNQAPRAHASAEVKAIEFQSRELVDVEYQRDGAVSILLSVPGTSAPGLYRWPRGAAAPTKLCAIAFPSTFSFDRRVIIERERGAKSRVRVYAANTCRLIAEIAVDGRVLDVDTRGRWLAAAVRLPDKQLSLQLYRADGELISSTSIGRNVEMGFAPDGNSLVNFDLSDMGLQAWRLPRLTNMLLPGWAYESDVTFIPGSRFVKRFDAGELSIALWPDGHKLFTIPAERELRLRRISDDGLFGIAHRHEGRTETLEWIDFARQSRSTIATDVSGSIDNAAFSRDLKEAAWVSRGSANDHRVIVYRREIPTR